MKGGFTQKDEQELHRLLTLVRHNNYRWPSEFTLREAHRTISFWAVEIVIIKGSKVLLVPYEGGSEELKGVLHLPGGFSRWNDASIQKVCTHVAKRELGIDVKYLRTLDAYKWAPGEHPYGSPLSLYVLCEALGSLPEDVFYPLADLPEMLPIQRRFLEELAQKAL